MHELAMQHVTSAKPAKEVERALAYSSFYFTPSNSESSSSNVLASILGILDTSTKFQPQETRSLPVFFFAQLGHAAISLIKMYYVAKSDVDFRNLYPVTSEMVESRLSRLIELLHSSSHSATPLAATSFLRMMIMLRDLFIDHKDRSIESIRAKYGTIPSMKEIQILDLEEPQPTPQQRSTSRQVGKAAQGALQLLSEVAVGESNVSESSPREGLPETSSAGQFTSEDGGITAMGQMIGAGHMGSLSDEGIFGIMQTMWTKRIS